MGTHAEESKRLAVEISKDQEADLIVAMMEDDQTPEEVVQLALKKHFNDRKIETQNARSGCTRLRVNINDWTTQFIRTEKHLQGKSATEITRRAFDAYGFILSKVRSGHKVVLIDRHGDTEDLDLTIG